MLKMTSRRWETQIHRHFDMHSHVRKIEETMTQLQDEPDHIFHIKLV
ncbi:hypothetical protein LINPERPRIM_LOCUS28700 [Linum perenne]